MVSLHGITNAGHKNRAAVLTSSSSHLIVWASGYSRNKSPQRWSPEVLRGALDGDPSVDTNVSGQGQHVLVPGATSPLEARRYAPFN